MPRLARLLTHCLSVLLPLTVLSSPAAAAPTSTSFQVAAWNEKSFPAMSMAAYVNDIERVTARPGLGVLLAAEISTPPERQLLRADAAVHHLETRGIDTDTAIAFHRGLLAHTSARWKYFHRAPGGPASPARRFVLLKAHLDGLPVAFIALHLTNGCDPSTLRTWYHAARCNAVAAEVSWVRLHLVRPLHADGWTVVVGGDMNRGLIVWSSQQVSVRPSTLMQIAVIPAAGVHAHLSGRLATRTGLLTDHDLLVVTVHLTTSTPLQQGALQ